MINDSVLSHFAAVINRALASDPQAMQYLREQLAGHVMAIHVEDFACQGYLQFEAQGVVLCATPPLPVDVSLSGRLMALVGLSPLGQAGPVGAWPKSVSISGDMQFAEKIKYWLGGLSIDWPTVLAYYLGDGLASGMTCVFSGLKQHISQGVARGQVHGRDFINDEVTAMVSRAEMTKFLNAVDTLRHATARLEVRLNHWAEQQEDTV